MNKNPRPKTRLQALCTLNAIGALQPFDLVAALHDEHFGVREQAVRFVNVISRSSQTGGRTPPALNEMLEGLIKLADDPSPRVRFQLALTFGAIGRPEYGGTLAMMAIRKDEDPNVQAAILNASAAHADEMVGPIL